MAETDTNRPDDPLFGLYERYIGEPETQTEVYVGFGVFFGGLACAVLGLALFLFSAVQYGIRTPGYFALAQPGYLLGMLSVPLALLGIVVLLPTERRMTAAAGVGVAVTAAAAVAFVLSYPDRWFEFGTRNTLAVVGAYAAGLTVVTAVTGSALVAHRVERAQTTVPPGAVPESAEESVGGETVTDEQVEADIDEAMSDVELTWGGVEREEHRDLEFTQDYADESSGEIDIEAERTVDPGGVDDEVRGLRQLKGGDSEVETSESGVDDQTAALNALKEQKREGEVEDVADDDGPLDRLLGRLFD
ncbi:MAG: permease [Halolamina sp.]